MPVVLSNKKFAYQAKVEQLLNKAGIQLNGPAEEDIHVNRPDFYPNVLANGSLGLGESYVNGWWDCERLDIFFYKILSAGLEQYVSSSFSTIMTGLQARIFNGQTSRYAAKNASVHYDLGNDLFQGMLDKRLTYTCGYWEGTDNLDAAQEAKLDLSCRKLYLEPGMKVLDIGCGWGSFARYAAEKYGVHVTGITLAKEQLKLGKELCHGLPVELLLMDYRQIKGKYDRIVSLGMFEHVGYKNYRTFFEVAARSLKDEGLFLLHTIGGNQSKTSTEPWIAKYIFPNSLIPSMTQIGAATENIFVLEDLHNFGSYYDKTLMAWNDNFERNWPSVKSHYGGRFYRMWRYYLLSCAGSFRARNNHLWQMVFTKRKSGVYKAVR